MIDRNRFALNRIACPSLNLEDFFRFTADLGLSKVELRNDLPGGAVIDDRPPAEVAELARRHGVRILSINALQKFNLESSRAKNRTELETMLALSTTLHVAAIVLCPNNDTQDRRDARGRMAETVAALKTFGPSFASLGIQGWVEPLGFAESSLSSLAVAWDAVKASGFDCYRLVYDTFHHHLGPESEQAIDGTSASSRIGLIHVSGVEAAVSKDRCRDEHRVLPSPSDRTASREQVARLVSLGYAGDISFEPFAADVQRMSRAALAAALSRSIEYLSN